MGVPLPSVAERQTQCGRRLIEALGLKQTEAAAEMVVTERRLG